MVYLHCKGLELTKNPGTAFHSWEYPNTSVLSQHHQKSFSIRWWRDSAVVAFVGVYHVRNWVTSGRFETIALFWEWGPHGIHTFYPECDIIVVPFSDLRKWQWKFLSSSPLGFTYILEVLSQCRCSWSFSTSSWNWSYSTTEIQYHTWKP